MLEPNQWQRVAAFDGIEVYPFVRKPDLFCSNSCLIATDELLIIVDPGARADQAAELEPALAQKLDAHPRELLVLLTHCHVDHAGAVCAATGGRFAATEVAVLAAKSGIDALSRGDASVTQAELLKLPLAPLAPMRSGFCVEQTDVPIVLANGTTLQLRREMVEVAPELIMPRYLLPLGGAAVLEIYPTAGHAPDHLCLRLGELLLLADLPFASQPLVAGIIGWDPAALLRSLNLGQWILQTQSISCCLLGHGKILLPQAAQQMLAGVQRQTNAECRTFDSEQAQILSAAGIELLEVISDLFTVIGGRLCKLAYSLELLDESELAGKRDDLAAILQVDEVLTSFNQTVEKFVHGELKIVALLYSTLRTVQKIQTLHQYAALTKVIDPLLPRQAQRLLHDFVYLARGLGVEESFRAVHLPDLLRALVRSLDQADTPKQLLAAAEEDDDDQIFAAALCRRLAQGPVLKPEMLGITTASVLSADVWLAPDAFADTLLLFCQSLAAAGATMVQLELADAEACLQLTVTAQVSQSPSERLRRGYNRVFSLYGATFACQYRDGCLEAVLGLSRGADHGSLVDANGDTNG